MKFTKIKIHEMRYYIDLGKYSQGFVTAYLLMCVNSEQTTALKKQKHDFSRQGFTHSPTDMCVFLQRVCFLNSIPLPPLSDKLNTSHTSTTSLGVLCGFESKREMIFFPPDLVSVLESMGASCVQSRRAAGSREW